MPPTSAMPMVSSMVAMGRKMKGVEMLMDVLRTDPPALLRQPCLHP